MPLTQQNIKKAQEQIDENGIRIHSDDSILSTVAAERPDLSSKIDLARQHELNFSPSEILSGISDSLTPPPLTPEKINEAGLQETVTPLFTQEQIGATGSFELSGPEKVVAFGDAWLKGITGQITAEEFQAEEKRIGADEFIKDISDAAGIAMAGIFAVQGVQGLINASRIARSEFGNLDFVVRGVKRGLEQLSKTIRLSGSDKKIIKEIIKNPEKFTGGELAKLAKTRADGRRFLQTQRGPGTGEVPVLQPKGEVLPGLGHLPPGVSDVATTQPLPVNVTRPIPSIPSVVVPVSTGPLTTEPYSTQEPLVSPDVLTPQTQQELKSAPIGAETTAGIDPSKLRTFNPFKETIPKEEIIKRSTIVKNLDKAFAPIRVGKFRKKASGIFKVTPEVIRTKKANNIETITHEVGHAIHKLYFSAPGTRMLTGAPFSQWSNELIPMAYPGADKKTVEGFAEFVRLYVTNPVDAKEKAPNFFPEFDSVLAREMPEIRDVLHKARDDFDKWNRMGAVAKIKSQISTDETNTPSGFTFDKFYTATVDKFHPLEEAVKEITKGDKNLEGADLYKLARLYQGVQGKADTFLTYKPFKFDDFSFQGKGLKEILQPFHSKADLDNFRVYATARRSLELSGRGKRSGITPEDARKAIDEVKKQTPEVVQSFEEIGKYQDRVLEYLRDSGVLSPKAFSKIKKLNKSYIPFYRVFEEQKPGMGQKGFADLFNPVKRLTREGSDREIIDPLESVIKNTYAFIKKAEQNRVGLELLNLSQQDKSGRFVERLPTALKPIPISNKEIYDIFDKYGNWKETTTFKKIDKEFIEKIGIKDGVISKPIQKLEMIVRESLMNKGMTEGEAGVFVKKLKGAKSSKEINEIVEKVVEKQTILHTFRELELDIPEVINVFRSTAYSKAENILTVFKDGKPVSLQLDPELYKAVLQLDRPALGMITRILSVPAKTLRAGATALSPEFAARNPLRDQFTAYVFSEFGFKPGIDFTRGLFHMLRKDKVFQRFKQSGAEHSMLVSLDRDYMQKNIRDLVRRLPAPNKILNPLELLRTLSEWSEMATRVGEFNRGLKQLGTGERRAIETAGLAAREVGLDFARMGSQMQALNMVTAFQNAAIQGLDKPVRQFKDHPGRTISRILAGITIPAIMLWFVNQDDPDIQELPQWQRDLFFLFKPPRTVARIAGIDPNTIIRIPKPFEMGILFGSFPERILDWMKTNDPQGLKDVSKTLAEGLVPPWIPTAATPLIENYSNRSIFLDRPIVQRGREELAPPYQHGPFVSELSKALGKHLNYSPAKIDNIFRGWFAGAGRLGIEAIDALLEEFNIEDLPPAPDPTLSDIPLVRAFIARSPSANTKSIRDFYNIYNETKQYYDTGKFLLKNNRAEEGSDWIREKMDLVLTKEQLKTMKNTANLLKTLRNFIDAININKNLDPLEKRRRIDNTYRRMTRTAKTALKTLKRQPETKR